MRARWCGPAAPADVNDAGLPGLTQRAGVDAHATGWRRARALPKGKDAQNKDRVGSDVDGTSTVSSKELREFWMKSAGA